MPRLIVTGKRIVSPESVEQCIVAAWLDYHSVIWNHIPNGGLRAWSTAVELKRCGVKRGFPDNVIWTPPPAHHAAIGCVFELKREKGGKLSDEQRWWLQTLTELKWHTFVARGAGDAIRQLKLLGYGKTGMGG